MPPENVSSSFQLTFLSPSSCENSKGFFKILKLKIPQKSNLITEYKNRKALFTQKNFFMR